MKKVFSTTLMIVLLAFCFQACKKNQALRNPAISDEELIESAQAYYHDSLENRNPSHSGNYRIDAAKNIDWQTAEVRTLSNGPTVIASVHYVNNLYIKSTVGEQNLFDLNDLTHIFIYKDSAGTCHAQIVTVIPDTASLKTNAQMFTGFIVVDNWSGQNIHKYKYNPDGSIFTYKAQSELTSQASTIITSERPIQSNLIITVCYEIDGYNYAASDPDNGYHWTELLGCSSMFFPAYYGSGGGDGGGPSGSDYGSSVGSSRPLPARVPLITRGPNVIANIKDYFKCFTNVGGTDHTYKVTVCVDQPVSGTRSPWRLQNSPGASSAANNPVDVGHTFLIFSEGYGGTTITRNIGFYPRGAVYPWSPSDQGQLNDNEGTSYNISVSMTVTNAQFFNMLNYVSQGNNPGYLYDINTNNCTTFVLNALQAGFVNISSQVGSWSTGSGYDPGDLGEDLRNMPLSPNMSRSTIENSHPNVGNCN